MKKILNKLLFNSSKKFSRKLIFDMKPFQSMNGFTKKKIDMQMEYEERFSKLVSNKQISHFSHQLSKRTSRVSTDGNIANLKYAIRVLQKSDLQTEVKTYDVYMPKLKNVSITQTAPEYRQLDVFEDISIPKSFAQGIVPGFNAYSPPGNVQAELVYANYGRPEDFDLLARKGISVKNKIVIARYGENFRGVKPDQAEQRGAVGLIFYSDPADSGYTRGLVYPEGPWKPQDGIERGSVLYLFKYPGDPLTPGKPSLPGIPRIDPADAASLPVIPTLPLSYGQARYLLEALKGKEAPSTWQGGLPFTYQIGPGPTRVQLTLDIDYQNVPIHNLIARIPGTKFPEQTIVIGAHRDTWVYGANDNISGWSSAMEFACVLGNLYRRGWKPERSIVIAGWDGEEYGLLGSTEWVEENRQELMKNAVAYLNVDVIAGQFFEAGAVPSLKRFIYSLTKEVIEPRTGSSIYNDWKTRSEKEKPTVGQLGSGEDFTAFLDHAGIPSARFSFQLPNGLYHTIYDNLDSIHRFLDPGYKHHGATAKLIGKMAIRLANADVLPFYYSDYAEEVVRLLNEFSKKDTMGVGLTDVLAKAKKWQSTATLLEEKAEQIISEGTISPKNQKKLQNINKALLQQERDLIREKGLPERPWYKHQIWAPGLTTGYKALPLPALSHALQSRDRYAFKQAVELLIEALSDATRTAKSALRD
ncbi:M28 family metallopeptidase [Alkalihalobacillus sp. AL-G]|uniref:M28 family metallopeptidase n=1 Tax=Alkalihalobacillus sp. AL-G TaxID=2926399 RepID=UPI00272D1C9B|nr:M28 family metallopeptidase [Alkalihalobacillus sp. AL-G]WLD94417.1 M28 family peptidase [Alkalihalobacillus sp. AL-G]